MVCEQGTSDELTGLEGKLLHVVGGGAGQLPLVSKARDMGLRVLVTDMFENPPCRELADYFAQVNTVDREGTLQTAKECGVDGITTDQTDVAVPTVAFVAERLSLAGIGHETALRFSDKRLMRESLSSICPSNVPRFKACGSLRECLKYVQQRKGELVVKPVDSQGSRGVHFIDAGDPAKPLIEDAFLNSRRGEVLVEARVRGCEIAVESVVLDREPHLLAISKKDHYPENDALDAKVVFPATLASETEEAVRELNDRVIRGLGLPFGLTHAEYMVECGRVWIIEIAARGGGSGVSSHIVPFLTGFDTCEALIRFALGLRSKVDIGDYRAKRAILEFLRLSRGRVKRVAVDPDVYRTALAFSLTVRPGDLIEEIQDSRSRPGFFIVAADNDQDLEQKRKRVQDGIVVECE